MPTPCATQKVQVLRAIHPMTVDEVQRYTVRGQYGPGEIGGKQVPGYRQEPGVHPDSTTETFVAVEFHVETGDGREFRFTCAPASDWRNHLTEIARAFQTHAASLVLAQSRRCAPQRHHMRIQPNEGISLSFGAKQPGQEMRAIRVNMDFAYKDAFGAETPAAYETLLLDAMRGDPTLFTRRDEVEAEWRIITPIEEAWKELPPPKFPNYAAGSEGPEEANKLIRYDRKQWRLLTGEDGKK